MKALVTGSTGFIGSHLVEKLVQRGYRVRCLIRKTTKVEYINNLPVEFVHSDFDDIESLMTAVDSVDYVFHIGGVTKSKDKKGYFKGNHETTKNLLTAVLKQNPHLKRFILASSLTAVGPGHDMTPVDETTPYHPVTTYGKSKMEAEKECLSRVSEIPVTIIRPPAVYGPRDKDIYAFFKSVNGHLIPLSGFKRKVLSLVHAYDLVDGIIAAAEHPKSAGKVYFISNEEVYDWEQFGNIAGKVLGRKTFKVRIPHFALYTIAAISESIARLQGKAALINIEKARDGVQTNWLCSPKKAQAELGFKAKLSLEAGIENTIRWYKENAWLK
ncbi:MAG TPA: NAD-dependent epimerase/dehydratase family protein [Candidatus Acidoferrales bacterium]|nr:NAD-dependent epimerase/dehydratase family protein [Candidatus Acidoferrales bacterium]